ncbi:MAG: PD-(D/E)XK nuclease family protein, partial [Kiritimatiellia bacterium]
MPNAVFLDWSSPLLPSLANALLPRSGSGPLDLGEFLILAPTRQAGRRLREYLTHSWRERGGTALLSLEVHPPSFLLQPDDDASIAHPFDWLEAWQHTLVGTDPASLPALMPQQTAAFSPSTALEFGKRLQKLRDELLDAGLSIAGVADSPRLLSEQERWRDLATLERAYLDHLLKRNLLDPCEAKREHLAHFIPPKAVRTLILAAVPDPSPVILSRLKELDRQSDLKIEVWIHAPESEAACFDEWGIPGEVWRERFLGYETEPGGWIESLADPATLARRMAGLMAGAPPDPDLAFGLLDDSLVLPLQQALSESGHLLYHPKPTKLADSSYVRLLTGLDEQRTRQDPASLRALWRNPDLLSALRPEHPQSLLREWETYAADAFPDSAQSVSDTLPEGPLKQAWQKLSAWIGEEEPLGILRMLETLYAEHQLNPNDPEQRYQLRQVTLVADLLQEAARRQQAGHPPSSTVILQVLKSQSVDPPRVEGTLTAEGWLELAYHPAPQLLLVGMQEGRVPAVNAPDPFLPNQLREELGLRGDRDWLARDAYLFHCMIQSRAPGDVRVWVLKRNQEGSPLLPSRLLFACPDELMLKRAELLFQEPPPPPPQPAPAPGLCLDPARIPVEPVSRLSITALNHYLECPTRFYLRHVLNLRSKDDLESEPHAAAFGDLLHKVLEEVVQQGPCSPPQWNQRCGGVLDALLRRRFGNPARMSLRVIQHSALARLRAAGKVQQTLWQEGWTPLAYEEKMERVCKGVTIVGKIDRIDVHPDLGIHIIDYKTHDIPDPPEKMHLSPPREGRESIQFAYKKKTRQWSNLQLPLYRWLCEESPLIDASRPMRVSYFNLPKSVEKTSLETWEAEPELAPEARRTLDTLLDLIQQGVWHPMSAPTRFDDFTPLLHHGNDW